jgi:hypothetical protein
MRIDFIGHAALLIRSGELALITDPWWVSPAYYNQWYPYPFPVPERYDLTALDALFLSHGHEDHMHEPTLKELKKDLTLLMAKSYDSGNLGYLRELGFQDIKELPSGSSYRLRKGKNEMRISIFTYLGDSMLAVEADGQVLLNVNDALHCVRPEVIAEYCRQLRARFPRIDYLFCGFGGASYFPNCFRVPGKDDKFVAYKREELFMNNFALVSQLLEPKYAFPFAAHFILPSENNWWISRLRFEMRRPAEIFSELWPNAPVGCYDLSPGDYVENGQVVCSEPETITNIDDIRKEVLARYPTPAPEPVGAKLFAALIEKMHANAERFTNRLGKEIAFEAAIKIVDYPAQAILVKFANGQPEISTIDPVAVAKLAPTVVIEVAANILLDAMQWKYGRDLICIGYGAIVHIQSLEAMDKDIHTHLLGLITPYPTWRERLVKHPWLCLTYMLRDTGARFALKRKLGLTRGSRPAQNPLYALDEWA